MTSPRACIVACALLLLGLAGCGPTVQVTRFHNLPPVPEGKSVIVVAGNGEASGSLEFRHYARLVVEALRQNGYPPPALNQTPDLVARFGWSVGNGRVEQTATPVYGPVGPGYFVRRADKDGKAVSVYVPPPQGVIGQTVDVYTVYDAAATLEIASNKPDGGKVFEGRALSTTRTPDISPLMPALVKAMFAGFPGSSGSTVTVQPES
jgi:hypothetical protein